MLEAIRKRREDDEQGFTLIELMVVILIIAILIAIAIPTFLGAQKRAKDRAAQSDLRNGLSAAKTIATDFEGAFCANETCTSDSDAAFASALESEEGALDFSANETAPTAGTDVVVSVEDWTNEAGDTITNGQVVLTRRSKSGKVFGLVATSDGNVTYCADTDAEDAASAADPSAECTEDDW